MGWVVGRMVGESGNKANSAQLELKLELDNILFTVFKYNQNAIT